MAPHALPGRVASPPHPIAACPSGRAAGSPPRLWPNLSAETQVQIARIVAELMRRMGPATDDRSGREMTRADRGEGC